MNIKIINKNKISFITGGDKDNIVCECYYDNNNIGLIAGIFDEDGCAKKCCDEGMPGYGYVFINKNAEQQSKIPKKCLRQMKNTQSEVFHFLGYALVVGAFGSLLNMFK